MRKLSKAKDNHPRIADHAQHEQWKQQISAGMRRAAQRRRQAGLVGFIEAAVRTLIPLGALKRMAAAGEIRIIMRGARRYIHVSEVRRLRRIAA